MDLKNHKLNISDYRAVAKLHCEHINKGFLATLGDSFLTLLYEAIDTETDSVLLVEKENDIVVGFIAGTHGLRKIYKHLLSQPLRLIYSLKNCFLSPSKIFKIVEILLITKGNKPSINIPNHELLSIVINPAYQGKGYAENLFEALCSHFRNLGASSFSIVVGKNLDRAHAFYIKMGSVPIREMQVHKGAFSVLYVKELSS